MVLETAAHTVKEFHELDSVFSFAYRQGKAVKAQCYQSSPNSFIFFPRVPFQSNLRRTGFMKQLLFTKVANPVSEVL